TGRVLDGRITRVTGCVGQDGLARTTLYGQEEAGYQLRKADAAHHQAGAADPLAFAKTLLKDVPLAQGSTLPGELTDFTVRSGSALVALSDLSTPRGVAVVVRDRKV